MQETHAERGTDLRGARGRRGVPDAGPDGIGGRHLRFVNLCGFNEPLFMDMEFVAKESVFKGRPRRAR